MKSDSGNCSPALEESDETCLCRIIKINDRGKFYKVWCHFNLYKEKNITK